MRAGFPKKFKSCREHARVLICSSGSSLIWIQQGNAAADRHVERRSPVLPYRPFTAATCAALGTL